VKETIVTGDEDINFVHLLFPSRGYWISGEISSHILAGQLDCVCSHGGFSVPFIRFYICTSEPDNFTLRRDEAILERALTFFWSDFFHVCDFHFPEAADIYEILFFMGKRVKRANGKFAAMADLSSSIALHI
ncbi:hypothetical protein Tco_0159188, partial [Tanacetum coccineum]